MKEKNPNFTLRNVAVCQCSQIFAPGKTLVDAECNAERHW